jgi:hypothetical protein
MTKKRRKELQSVDEFERELREEISVFIEFLLTLAIALALNIKGGWEQGTVRRALDVLRVAHLGARPGRATRSLAQYHRRRRPGGRGKVARGGPGGTFGIATYREGDTGEDLLQHARGAAR